jgi:hypothetical protein
VPGSVIAFTAYPVLVGRIGPDHAAYSTVPFPVVASSVSTMLEGYHWTLPAFGGVALVLGQSACVHEARWASGASARRSMP